MTWDERLGRRIKLRGLHILQATIEAGSMAKAAKNLAMTQPAVSYAIAEMEQVLGVPLLDRSPHGVLPTVYGEALARRSVTVFNELRQGIDDIAFLADPSAGEVRIGATPPMSIVAATAIDRLIQHHPRMVFHLVVEPTEVLLRDLHQRGIDLAGMIDVQHEHDRQAAAQRSEQAGVDAPGVDDRLAGMDAQAFELRHGVGGLHQLTQPAVRQRQRIAARQDQRRHAPPEHVVARSWHGRSSRR